MGYCLVISIQTWKGGNITVVLSWQSHLDQKYDQEVEVSDSSELFKQVLGNEVPEGVLLERAKQKLLSVNPSNAKETVMSQLVKHRRNECGSMKCVTFTTWSSKSITWLSNYITNEWHL